MLPFVPRLGTALVVLTCVAPSGEDQRRRGVLMMLYLLSLVLVGGCRPPDQPLTDADRRTITTSVDSATRAFEQAQRARDPERAIGHLAPDFYMYNDGVRSGHDSVVAGIRRTMGTFRHLEPGFANVEVRALGPAAALVSLTFRDSITTAAGETLRFRGATTLVWERRGADWLIVYADADHYPPES